MKNYRPLIATVLALLLLTALTACQKKEEIAGTLTSGPQLASDKESLIRDADLIVLGEVTAQKDTYVIEIEKTYKGTCATATLSFYPSGFEPQDNTRYLLLLSLSETDPTQYLCEHYDAFRIKNNMEFYNLRNTFTEEELEQEIANPSKNQ